MIGFEKHAPILAMIATDGTFTSAIQIGGANRVALEVPTFEVGTSTESCNVYALVANTNTTSSFRRLKDVGVYSASSGIQDWEVPSSIGDYTVLCRPVTGFNYVMFELYAKAASKTSTAGLSCYVHIMQ